MSDDIIKLLINDHTLTRMNGTGENKTLMKKDMNNIHDKSYKTLFSNKDIYRKTKHFICNLFIGSKG